MKIVPFIDRSDLVHFTTHTVLHNLTEGFILVTIVLFLFLGQRPRRPHRGPDHSFFSIVRRRSVCDLRQIPANLLSLGALDFGMVVDGAVVMVENIVRHMGHRDPGTPMPDRIRAAAHEVQRPVFYAMLIIITAYLPIFTLQRVEGRLFRPMAWTVAFALLGALIFSMTRRAGAGQLPVPQRGRRVAQSGGRLAYETLPDRPVTWSVRHRWVMVVIAVLTLCGSYLSGRERRDRIGIPAPSGRRRDLGARHPGAQHRTE